MEAVNSILVILLRSAWPTIAGNAFASEDDLQKAAGALILLGSVAYHAWQRQRGKKRRD